MATEPMADARLAEIRRGLECGCYDQKWVGELMAEIDRLRTVPKRDRLRLELADLAMEWAAQHRAITTTSYRLHAKIQVFDLAARIEALHD